MTEQISRPRLDDADFAYIMSDDSMINARILPGDMVLVRQQDTVNDGDIAVAMQGELVRIGKYSCHEKCEVLTQASPKHYSIFSYFDNPSFTIIGKVIACICDIS